MTGGDQQDSLWSGWSDRQPEDLDDVVVRWELDEPAASTPPATAQQPVRRRGLALGVLAAIAMVAVVTVQSGGSSLVIKDVPSYWDDVTMTCHTTRIEEGERALEVFRCRAVAGGTLPPGVYRSPDARWTSDLTRREARANQIEISQDGELTGWAAY